jgi:predicted AAA+ superfamily ATPase
VTHPLSPSLLTPAGDSQKGKVLIIYGARQVGKTTLLKKFLEQTDLNYQSYTGDDFSFAADFAKCELRLIEQMVSGIDLLVIDEAQKIENIGTALKLVVDNFPNRYVIVTGSSSFGLANSTKEPLTGRKNIITLYPIALKELNQTTTPYELDKQIGLDKNTVQRYLDLLEKSFVLISLGGFSRNLRKEVSKMNMYYFMDLGIRNAVIANFNPLNLRNDVGQLWENFLFIERMKRNAFAGHNANYYYWRTYDQQEIDLIEESGGKLRGFEFKWNPLKKAKAPKAWIETYDNASYEVITKDNYREFIIAN